MSVKRVSSTAFVPNHRLHALVLVGHSHAQAECRRADDHADVHGLAAIAVRAEAHDAVESWLVHGALDDRVIFVDDVLCTRSFYLLVESHAAGATARSATIRPSSDLTS